MKLYIFAEQDELEDIAEALYAKIAAWAEPKTTVTAIYRHDDSAEPVRGKYRDIEVGIEFSAKNSNKLKEPLNTLYKLAKDYKCEFVVGQIEDDTYQDVCYFGHEEGRPDMFEIANYLEL